MMSSTVALFVDDRFLILLEEISKVPEIVEIEIEVISEREINNIGLEGEGEEM